MSTRPRTPENFPHMKDRRARRIRRHDIRDLARGAALGHRAAANTVDAFRRLTADVQKAGESFTRAADVLTAHGNQR